MVKKSYVPDKGDVVWLNLDPISFEHCRGKKERQDLL